MATKKSSKKQKTTASELIILAAWAVFLYAFTSFVWILIVGGVIISITSFYMNMTPFQHGVAIVIGLAISGIGYFLSRLISKNLSKTTPPWSM